MKYEYEAVSGDQNLFDALNSDPSHNVVFLGENLMYSTDNTVGRSRTIFKIIAERKVTEKYIPKAGDVFEIIDHCFDHGELLCLKSNDGGIAFEYLNKEEGHFDSISVSAKFLFIRKHDDKAANPVNFISEKYVPRVGDIFAVSSKDDGQFNPNVFHCILNVGRVGRGFDNYIDAKCDNNSNVFASFHVDMNDFHLIHRPSTK